MNYFNLKKGLSFFCFSLCFLFCFLTTSLQAQDTDSDGILNATDQDDDNDGILSTNECGASPNSTSSGGQFVDNIHWITFDDSDFVDNSLDAGDKQTMIAANGDSLIVTVVSATGTGHLTSSLYTNSGLYQGGYVLSSTKAYVRLGGAQTYTFAFEAFDGEDNPINVEIVAADGEAAANGGEFFELYTNAPGGWSLLEDLVTGGGSASYSISSGGLGTSTVAITGTATNPRSTPLLHATGADTLTYSQITPAGAQGVVIGWFVQDPCILDTDSDGILDYLDLDSDNDGIPDLIEAGGVDVNGDGIIDDLTDTDMDGIPDLVDNVDFGSGSEVTSGTPLSNPDTDGDGIADNRDLDSDGDGIPDLVELGGVDSNGDGIIDNLTDADNDGFADDFDPDTDGTPGIDAGAASKPLVETNGSGNLLNGETGASLDSDGDGISDANDLDSDNDGIPDLVEAGGIDTDGNGLVDVTTDADGDGFADIFDTDNNGIAGVDDATLALVLTGGTDTDGDGKADDTAITHTDGDGNSVDTDGDGRADFKDLDADNDGVPDIIEAGGASPNNDGMVDTGTLPWDSDDDGLADTYDGNNSGTPLIETTSDTNNDGKVNSTETMTAGGSNNMNADGDDVPNHLDLDSDNDGISDVIENASGDPDADNGGSGDLDARINNYTDSADNNGWNDSSTTSTTDTDSDGIPDYLDIDSDNDGIVDYLEGTCTTCPTFTSPTGNDSNGNGILDIYESLTLSNSNGGTNKGVNPNIDDDSGNTTPDYLDTDTDNDGAFDWTEGYDTNGDGNSSDDLMTMATNYETATSNSYYVNATDTDADGIPDWLDNQPSVAGYDEITRPPFLNPVSPFWRDTDGDGLVDLFDASTNGTGAPTPNTTGSDDRDWRDMATSAVLPVTLVSFNGQARACNIELTWQTEEEFNFRHFELQRSENGTDFQTITSIKGKNKSSITNYNYSDQSARSSQYYRLKMVDLDGDFKYSNIVFVIVDCSENKFKVYPNPIAIANNAVNLEFQITSNEVQFELTNINGQVVRRMNLDCEPGILNQLVFDISGLAAGTYSIRMNGEDDQVQMLIIQ